MAENYQNFATENKNALAWTAAVLAFLLAFAKLGGVVSLPVQLFLCLMSSAIVLWVSSVVDDYIPSMLVLVSSVMLGIAPASVAFQGFASESLFLMLSLSGIGNFIMSSGIGYRACLKMANSLKGSKHFLGGGIFVMGIMMTPLIPSIVNRLQFVSSILKNIFTSLQIAEKSNYAYSLSFIAFSSVTILSSCFLTGSLLNFSLFNMISLQKQYEIYAIGWVFASLPLLLVMTLTTFVTSFLLGKKKDIPTEIHPETIQKKIKELGPITIAEKQAIAVALFFTIMLITLPFHKISIAWVSCICIIGMLLMRFINIQTWMNQTIVWQIIFSICFASGINSIILYLGLGDSIKQMVIPIFSKYIASDTSAIFALTIIVTVARFALPTTPAVMLLMSIGLPVSEMYEFSPWLCCLIFLHVADGWVFAYQSTLYKGYAEFMGDKKTIKNKQFFTHNLVITVIRIVGLMASIPWWRKLGLL